MPITEEIEAILLRCGEGKGGAFVPHHPEWVHTHVCQRADKRKGLVKGERYPVTKEGAKTMWRRTCKRAGIVDFRLHDFRHDLATNAQDRQSQARPQKALNHANIKTTTRYAHVLDDEVAAALEHIQRDQKSRNKSRSTDRRAS